MKVLKFGGTSVKDAAGIAQVARILKQDGPLWVVVSACAGITDQLYSLGQTAAGGDEAYLKILKAINDRHIHIVRTLLPVTVQSAAISMVMQLSNQLESIIESVAVLRELSPATKDRLMSFGELYSSRIMVSFLQSMDINAQWADARQLIYTNDNFGYAAPDSALTRKRFQEYNAQHKAQIYIMPGFIATGKSGHTTTLGRGGSDFSAAITAAALDAEALEIWTDVPGMMTADPRWVTHAKPILHLSYKEAMELSHFGAKVLYPPTVIPAMQANIPIRIKDTFHPDASGTLITANVPARHQEADSITGISCITEADLLTLEGPSMVGIPGFSMRLFGALAKAAINVILITQASSEHSISVGIQTRDSKKASEALNLEFHTEITLKQLDPVQVESGLSIVALVGDKMEKHSGISGRLFGALGRNGINVRAIAQGSSERNISVLVAAADTKKALNVLHEAFFESVHKQLNVYIVGTGNVGARLLDQIRQQQYYLLRHKNIQLRVMGLLNSRHMLIDDNRGIDLSNWQETQKKAERGSIDRYIETINSKNLRNSVLVDVTANEEVAMSYPKVLQKSVSVVACNKIANSSSMDYYRELEQTAQEFNARLYFETNVGAGLPVIGTMNDLISSGDMIMKINAVLSGTLNFVFNEYDGSRPFASVVQQAREEGYTEPDPRLDLSGKDVMRKILILARVSGYALEMTDIQNTDFMPDSVYRGDVATFFEELLRQEDHFRQLYQNAAAKGKKLKYIACFEGGKASVGLQEIAADSDFFHLYGKDNIVQLFTRRYNGQPLVIKGAGAGADVTASGIFADLIKTVYS